MDVEKQGQHTHQCAHACACESCPHRESEAVARLRERHEQRRHSGRRGRRGLVFWGFAGMAVVLCISAVLAIRAIELATISESGSSWLAELKQGNIAVAAEKFSSTANGAVRQMITSDLSSEKLMRDFHAALPQLKKAGYTLTELEIEFGIPPKLIPHFFHDPTVELHLDDTLKALQGNSVGTTLMLALAQAGDLQHDASVAGMQFNYIEVELGPVPSLKLQYKAEHLAGAAVREPKAKDRAGAVLTR